MGSLDGRCGINRERESFDFIRGDEEYKYRFGGVNSYVMRVKATKSSSCIVESVYDKDDPEALHARPEQ
jgi:hypothetical protein